MLLSDDDNLAVLQALGEMVRFNGKTIYGIFERDYAELDFDQRSVASLEPMITVRSLDVQGAAYGDVVERRGLSYRVVNIEPDGEGMTVMRLSE